MSNKGVETDVDLNLPSLPLSWDSYLDGRKTIALTKQDPDGPLGWLQKLDILD